eukprot:9475332-Pyramimonas_sp.AAC.2
MTYTCERGQTIRIGIFRAVGVLGLLGILPTMRRKEIPPQAPIKPLRHWRVQLSPRTLYLRKTTCPCRGLASAVARTSHVAPTCRYRQPAAFIVNPPHLSAVVIRRGRH